MKKSVYDTLSKSDDIVGKVGLAITASTAILGLVTRFAKVDEDEPETKKKRKKEKEVK